MSSSIPLSNKSRKRKEYRRRKQLRKRVLQNVHIKTLHEEGLGEASSPQVESSTVQYSQNWRALQQVLCADTCALTDSVVEPCIVRLHSSTQQEGLPTERKCKHSLPTTKTRAHHQLEELGESSHTVTAAPGPSLVCGRRSSYPSTSVDSDCLSLDCEMVGGGLRGELNMLARCSLVDYHGNVVYDTYVAPTAHVWDYRTFISGIRHRDLVGAPSFSTVQRKVASLLRGRILVGHDLKHDLKALSLTHPSNDIRDTFYYKPFRALFGGKGSSLQKLSKKVLGIDIQADEHSSIEDAQATMKLYQLHKKDWDRAHK